MSTIKRILVPFDFSEPSIHALEYAVNFVGREREVQLLALYVSKMELAPRDREDLEKQFAQLLGTMGGPLRIAPELIEGEGELVPVVMETVTSYDADLIIMGTMGDSVGEDAVTNTSQLVLEADCPVISVPFASNIALPKSIALVMGPEEIEDKHTMMMLLDVARTFDSKVHVLTIYRDAIYSSEKGGPVHSERNEETLEYYLEHFYTEHFFAKNQDVEQGIYQYITEKEIDLLAIMPRNHAQKTEPSEGRLTKLLTLHATVPVLTLD